GHALSPYTNSHRMPAPAPTVSTMAMPAKTALGKRKRRGYVYRDAEDAGAAGHPGAASHPRTTQARAHGSPEPGARRAARVWRRHSNGRRQGPGRGARRPGGWRQRSAHGAATHLGGTTG